MGMIEVGEQDKAKVKRHKGIDIDQDVAESIEDYRTYLVKEGGARESAFTDGRIINEVLRVAFRSDPDFQEWLAQQKSRKRKGGDVEVVVIPRTAGVGIIESVEVSRAGGSK